MLQIVDQKNVGAAELLLEGEGLLIAQGRKKAAHEIFRSEEENARTAYGAGFQGDRIQEVRLAITEAAMNEEQSHFGFAVFGEALGRLEGEFIRAAYDEACEALTRIG